MKNKTIFLIMFIILSTFAYSIFDRKTIYHDFFLTSNEKSDNEFIIDVESCIDDPCMINASKSGDSEYLIVASNAGVKYLWRSEP